MSESDRSAAELPPNPSATDAPEAGALPGRPVVPHGMKVMLRIGFAIGAILLLVAGVLAVREWRFIADSVHVTGTVSRVDREWMSGSSSSSSGYGGNRGGNWGYRVVASFPALGRTVEARSASLTSYTGYKVGDPIEVIYPDGQPDRAQLVRFVDRWMLVLVLGGIGGAFVAICAFGRWLTTLPGARITSSGVGFSVRSPVYSVEADLRPTSSSGVALPQRGGWPKAIVIGVVLIVGIGIGLLVASLKDRSGQAGVAQLAANAGGLPPAGSNGDGGPPPAPGWPSNFTVKAPTMPNDDGRATTPGWTDPANGGSTRTNLTMAARAFLARPEVDAAMQSALRRQVAKLGLPCPAITFAVGETLLFPTPFPIFGPSGTMERGLVRQRFIASGCPGRSPEFNVWVFAPGNGVPFRTVAGYPGTTRADLMLVNDATPVVLAIANRVSPGCASLTIADTRLANPASVDTEGPWREEWLVTGCGKMIAMTVDFIPDKGRGMTRIEVPEALARLLPST